MKRFGAFIFVVMLCVIPVIPVSAATGTEENPARASITKILKMPEGTSTPPRVGVNFDIDRLRKDGVSWKFTQMPIISRKTIKFTADDIGEVSNGVKTIRKETEGSIFDNIQFPSAGVYEYLVTEQSFSVANMPSIEVRLVLSYAEYNLKVYVANATNGGTYVKAVYADIIKNDAGKAASGKVDPAPGTSELSFVNSIFKQGDGTLEDAPLSVSKTTLGEFTDLYQKFTFSMNIAKPDSLNVAGVVYKGYVLDTLGNNITNQSHYDGVLGNGEHGNCIDFPTDSTVDVKLSHKEKLVFPDIHIGADYNVTEHGVSFYTPSLKINDESIVVSDIGVGDDLTTGVRLVYDGGNAVDYINTRDAIVPTSVIIDNLPYMLVLLLVVGAFVGFVVMKSCKRLINR